MTDPTASVGAEQTSEPGSAAPVDETPPTATTTTTANAQRSDRAAETGSGGPTNGAAAPTVEGSPPPDKMTGPGADAATPAALGAPVGVSAPALAVPAAPIPVSAPAPAVPAPAVPAAPIPAPLTQARGDALGAPVGVVSAAAGAPPREEVPWLIIWTAIGVVLAAGAAIELILALKTVIELIVIAGFLAVVLSPAVGLLVRLKLRRGVATTVVFLLGMCAFGGLGYLFIHPLYQEAIRFADDLPGTLARVQAGKGRIGSLIARYHLQKDAATYIPKIRTYLSHLGGPALSIVRTVLSGLGGLVLMSIMTFLMLLEGPSVVRGVLRVLPVPQARRVRRILDDIAKSVTGYVIGNFATSVIAGVICGTALAVLGVPFAVVFGVWVALVDLIPLVGGLLAGVPTVAFAFLYSPTAGIITLIVFLVYQQVENHLLNPLIMSRTVHLNPLWVLLSVLAGAELAGFIGALLAIPAAGTIHVIARDIWDERRGQLKTTPTVGPEHQPLA